MAQKVEESNIGFVYDGIHDLLPVDRQGSMLLEFLMDLLLWCFGSMGGFVFVWGLNGTIRFKLFMF